MVFRLVGDEAEPDVDDGGSSEVRPHVTELEELDVETIITYGSPLLIDPEKFPRSVHYLFTGGGTPLGMILIVDGEAWFRFVDSSSNIPLTKGALVRVGSNTPHVIVQSPDVDRVHFEISYDSDDGMIHIDKSVPSDDTNDPVMRVSSETLSDEYDSGQLLINDIDAHAARIEAITGPFLHADREHPMVVDLHNKRLSYSEPFFRELFDAADIKFEYSPRFLPKRNKVELVFFGAANFTIYFNCETEMFEVPADGEYIEVQPSMLIEAVLRYCI